MAEQKIFHMTIASLVFSILGLFIMSIHFVAIPVGVYAIFKVKNRPELKGTGFAIAGIAISVIDLVLRLTGLKLILFKAIGL